VLKVENLTFEREGKKVLDDISFCIEKGEKVVLLGLNGSGKTTLLKILNALYFVSNESFSFDSEIVTKKSFTKQFETAFRQKCSLLFQNYEAMFFCKNIYEDIAFSPSRFGLLDIKERVFRAANMFGLENRLDEFAFTLSGGEKQRAALACIFALSPEVLLLDEPTSALDPFWTARLVEILEASGACSVTATHNLSLAAELGERAIVMKEGRIVFDGKTAEFLNNKVLMADAGLLHSHKHMHDGELHEHLHAHDWN
jgi:cobalt/nickel transport system ATP-binding protein